MVKINKTNAARLLDKAKIAYELIPYEVDENDLSAVHVAAVWVRTSIACSRR
jgi:Cys-tRNA(Pro)/Cys-tRNA(Cys) deacylase